MPALNPNLSLDRPVRDFLQPQPLTLRAPWTVDHAIAHLRAQPPRPGPGPESQVLYFYVLSPDDRLVGVVPARKLLLSPGEQTLEELMDRSVITLRDTDTLFDACELFAMHRLLAIPVVDAEKRFLGTVDVAVYTDEVFDLAERQAAGDIFQLIGLHLEQTRNATLWRSYKFRMPWLLCNIAGGAACAVLASLFDAVLQQVLLLSLFIPIILTLAESISVQSMTLALQSVASGATLRRAAARELAASILLALTSACLVALLASFWRSVGLAPLVIGLAILLSMVVAAGVGTLLPRLIRHLKLNPTVASGPLVLALTDVATITVYLALATSLLLRT